MKSMTEKQAKITSGTKEYADSNVNIYSGCSNNCRYCYAKGLAIRFKRKTEENWKEMVLNNKAVIKGYKKRKGELGRIMFPSSHDITTESLEFSAIVLRKLLKVGNKVLIVTKPSLWCIHELLNRLEEFKSQIQFRFTITSLIDYRLSFWEPGAPSIEERLSALKLAFDKGFKTSISIEPYLDKNPIPLITKLSPHVSETIWVGRMNYIKANGIKPKDKKYYDFQRKICSWSNIQKIVSNIRKLPGEIKSKIRLKDTIKNLYRKKGLEVKIN